MRIKHLALFAFLVLVGLVGNSFGQVRTDETVKPDPRIKAGVELPAVELASISSTASGGLWSSPSTWVGGTVPGASDNVTIAPGSAVVIDTNAAAASLTIGDGSLTPAIVTFDPLTARSLTVNGDLNIQNAVAMLTTPSTGTITNHVITVGGNLTNNGILDLSTNSNQAGADLVFINSTSNTFGGNGPTNNVRKIIINKGLIGSSVLTVFVNNFTVQGSTNDTNASGYLTITAGTFKLSGAFSGTHRTFATANYTISSAGGFWLDNPNYNVTAQNGTITVGGLLQVSAGTLNIGTTAADGLVAAKDNINLNPWVFFEGGTVNVSGGFKTDIATNVFYQTGGAMHLCVVGNVGPCLGSVIGNSINGDIYIQNARPVPDENNPDYSGFLGAPAGFLPSVVHFGAANTPPTARFTASGTLPTTILDTTTGPHTLSLVGVGNSQIGDFNIGPGGTLDIGATNLTMFGNTFINNGTINTRDTSALLVNCGNGVFSGTGSFSGPALASLSVRCNNLTFNPAVGGLRARAVYVVQGQVINAGKLTIGNNDAGPSSLFFYQDAGLDSAPVFDLGTGKMKLTYSHTGARSAATDIPPSRTLSELTCDECTGPIFFTGGDLSVDGPLKLGAAIFDMGGNRLTHSIGPLTRTTGYVRGAMAYKFTGAGQTYTFYVGDNHLTPVFVQPTSFTTNPTVISVKPIDAALPGLPSATTASYSWQMEQSAPMTATVRLSYADEDVNGNESTYKLWRSSPQLPLLYSASQTSTVQNSTFITGLTSFNGTWGFGASIPTISISGRVTAANGNGLANATVMLTGGSLAAPRLIQTGPFGTYVFSGVDPGGEYTVTASAKRNRFATMERILSSWTSVANVDFVANPPE
jgi:hypothetical protein